MNVNESGPRCSQPGAVTLGFALIAIGAVLLMKNMGILWFRLSDLWPIALIGMGVEGLVDRRQDR